MLEIRGSRKVCVGFVQPLESQSSSSSSVESHIRACCNYFSTLMSPTRQQLSCLSVCLCGNRAGLQLVVGGWLVDLRAVISESSSNWLRTQLVLCVFLRLCAIVTQQWSSDIGAAIICEKSRHFRARRVKLSSAARRWLLVVCCCCCCYCFRTIERADFARKWRHKRELIMFTSLLLLLLLLRNGCAARNSLSARLTITFHAAMNHITSRSGSL